MHREPGNGSERILAINLGGETVAYVIAAPCIDHMDQTCVEVCPVDCITFDADRDRKLHIDPDSCIDCGSCEASCPNDAIFRADQLPREWASYAMIDALWYRDPEAARAEIERSAPTA